MLLGEGHGSIKANDGEVPRNVQDGLNDRLAHLGFGVIQLSSVIPGHGGTIVPVIYITGVTSPAVKSFEDHRGVVLIVIMVLDLNAHTAVI